MFNRILFLNKLQIAPSGLMESRAPKSILLWAIMTLLLIIVKFTVIIIINNPKKLFWNIYCPFLKQEIEKQRVQIIFPELQSKLATGSQREFRHPASVSYYKHGSY